MKGTNEIKRRIKSVKNTAQITKAMQLVAASKMKKAQQRAVAGRPYALLLADILESVSEKLDLEEVTSLFFEDRPVQKRGIILVSSDKGLCGALNANLFRLASDIQEPTAFISLGKKGTQFLSRSGQEVLADFPVSDAVNFMEVRLAVEFAISAFMEEKIDTVEIAFTRFVNTLTQKPVLEKLAPFLDFKEELLRMRENLGASEEATRDEDAREMIFSPDPSTILDNLPELFIKQECYQMVLEAKASEHSARMVAMKSATDNANSLKDDLTLEYNKIRQAAITQEILEIAASTQFN